MVFGLGLHGERSSAVNEVKGRKKESKRGELLDLLAQTAGIDDSEWDLDLPSAPYKVLSWWVVAI